MPPRQKRKNMTIQEKMKIFSYMNSNPQVKTQVLVAKHFNISTSTLSTILKNRKDVERKAQQGSVKRKRVREPKYAELEEVLTEWFHQQRSQNIPIDGLTLKLKAKAIALRIGHAGFTASNGWISRFQRRQEIQYKKISGESEAVSTATVDTWKTDILPGLIKDYEPKDIFNADELGLFFNLVPDRSMAHRTETCHGGKRSKERVTILLACNQDGTEKLQPLMIGKSEKPRCFKNVRHFPCEYTSNRKAWMTAEKCTAWLRRLDGKMRAQRRKILLFLDNCPAHPKDLDFLTNVRVEFLPPNTTSHTQPLDMGIIKVLKHYYRQKLVRRLLNLLSRDVPLTKKDWRINLFQAMLYVSGSWDAISATAIKNCFRKAGFEPAQQPADLEDQDEERVDDVDDADDADDAVAADDAVDDDDLLTGIDCPPGAFDGITERWQEIQQVFDTDCSFRDFVTADDFTPICEVQTVDEIMDMLRQDDQEPNADDPDTDEEDNDEEEAALVSRAEAMESLDVYRRFVGQQAVENEEIFRLINKIENLTIAASTRNLKQGTLDNYFNKK